MANPPPVGMKMARVRRSLGAWTSGRQVAVSPLVPRARLAVGPGCSKAPLDDASWRPAARRSDSDQLSTLLPRPPLVWGGSGTYLAAQFRRLATGHGPKKALVAVAHGILRIVYHLLLDEHPLEDLGEAYFDQRQRQQVSRRLTQRLERLGYRVQLEAITSAS
jgi:hypothetical protein